MADGIFLKEGVPFKIVDLGDGTFALKTSAGITGTVAATVADGADVCEGAKADAAVTTDAAGTVSAKLRGLIVHMIALLARLPAALGAGGGLKVDGSGTPLPVSGPLTDTELRATAVPVSDGALSGPGNPTVDSLTSVKIDLAASTANQVLVAAVASHQIWVYGLFMMADTAAGTVTLQDEDDTALSGTMAVSDEGGWVLPMSGNFAMPWIKVATGKALECDTGAATIDGILVYGVVNP